MTVVPISEGGGAKQEAKAKTLDSPSPVVRGSVVVAKGYVDDQLVRLWAEVPSKVERGSIVKFKDSPRMQLVIGEPRISYVSERLRGSIFFDAREDRAYLVLRAVDPIVDERGLDREGFAGQIEKVEYISADAASGQTLPTARSDFIPNLLPYRDEQPPGGYELRERRHWGKVAWGASIFTVAYGAGALAAVGSNLDGKSEYLFIPVAGPWLLWGHWIGSDKKDDMFAGLRTIAFTGLAVVSSGLQIAGLIWVVVGAQKHPWRYESATLSVTPVLAPSQTGVLATGRF